MVSNLLLLGLNFFTWQLSRVSIELVEMCKCSEAEAQNGHITPLLQSASQSKSQDQPQIKG